MASVTREQVIAYLSQLSRPELRELILDLEERWGIERPYVGEPVEVTMGMPYGYDPEFALVLLDPGPKPVQVMKALRERLGLGLREVKALVDGAPTATVEDLTLDRAHELRRAVTEAGGRAEIRER